MRLKKGPCVYSLWTCPVSAVRDMLVFQRHCDMHIFLDVMDSRWRLQAGVMYVCEDLVHAVCCARLWHMEASNAFGVNPRMFLLILCGVFRITSVLMCG